jgi:hypothetical protein
LLEASALSGPRAAFLASITACGLLVLASSARINELVFDQYLASQSDLLATNRIIARIDDLLADTPGAPTDDIPLAVIYDRLTMSGPRGSVWTSRQWPWSREFIFRLIDHRFHWVPPARYQREWEAARTRPEWPARGSVFLDDGVVVVVVTKVTYTNLLARAVRGNEGGGGGEGGYRLIAERTRARLAAARARGRMGGRKQR